MGDYWTICAADLVTALGDDPAATWNAIMSGACGLRPLKSLAQGDGRTYVAAEIPWLRGSGAPAPGLPADCSPAYALTRRVGRRALAQAGPLLASRTGLVLATTKAGIDDLERQLVAPGPAARSHFLPARLARDLATDLGLGGPVLATSNACASGLVAIAQAARLLTSGSCETMLVIGVDILSRFVLAGFSSLAALSARPCRPFDKLRDGLSLGESAAAIVLRRGPWPTALATIRGWAVTNDATHITAPSRTGLALTQALQKSLSAARLAPQDIGYINAHGTGTVYNDETESLAIYSVFADSPPVSSLKGYIGHTLGAAGVAEAILCTEVLRHGVLPASLGFENLGVSKPIRLLTGHQPAPGVNHVVTIKCGFGGINAAMILSRANHE